MLFSGKKIKCNVKYKDKKFVYELDKQNTVKDIYNLFFKEKSIPSNISELTIKLCSNKLPFNKNEYDTPLISFDKDKYNELWFEITKPYNCLDCQKIISKYCLICGKYYCSKCKTNEHEKHDFINIDPTDFKESIYLWNINVNATLSNDITQFNKLKDFIQENSLGTKIKLWKDNIIKKLNTFEKFINEICEMCNKVGNNYIIKKSEELNKLMLDLSKTEQIINNELSIGKEIKNINNNNYFSFDEAEVLIQKLKLNYNDIKSKNTDIKELSKIENINNLNNNMGNISSQIDELTKNSLLIFDSYKNFFEKYDKVNDDKTNTILYPKKYDTNPNLLPYSNIINNKNKKNYFIKKTNKDLKHKIYNLGIIKNNQIPIKETTLTSRDSYSSCNKTGSKLNNTKTIKVINSFKKDKILNKVKEGNNLFTELNLSKIKRKGDVDEKESLLYSERYRKFPSLDKSEKIQFLPLINN